MTDYAALRTRIDQWSRELGFTQLRITDLQLAAHAERLQTWLARGQHGEMHYLAKHVATRAEPTRLLVGARRALVVRMDYGAPAAELAPVALRVLADPSLAYVSRYALGRDYHKVMRPRLGRLADLINRDVGHGGFRACVDSAPVLEKALAERAGLGWFGKHTLILDRSAGSWFFLGVLLTDLPLPIDASLATPSRDPCGSCRACLDACPTAAFVGPRDLDARRCISYLTIEHRGSVPVELRAAMGNRIFGCDDCQLACPWNRQAPTALTNDFLPRTGLDAPALLDLFAWTADDFDSHSRGSPLRRLGYPRFLRNIAIALGNAPYSAEVVAALRARRPQADVLLAEHITWAIDQQLAQAAAASDVSAPGSV